MNPFDFDVVTGPSGKRSATDHDAAPDTARRDSREAQDRREPAERH